MSSSSSTSSSYVRKWSSSTSSSSSTPSSYIQNWSSSSRSSASSRSTSSFSSVSFSKSSLSSLSSWSSLSFSSSESSSTTSIDSGSSSSESIGNVSTSSMSSIAGWNKTKPLLLGTSAVNSISVLNRLAQTITLVSDTWSIGKVYCYFYGLFGTSSAFTLHLDICDCDSQGKPLSVLFSSTIPGSNIAGDGWYAFSLNISSNTPSNGYLSFVVWQENGDEDNYVLWGYNPSNDIINTMAWLSSDNISWTEQSDIVRAMKVIGDFNAYDLTDFRILTPPAGKETITHSLTGGINDGTKFIQGSYQYSPDKIIIDYPNVIISFVVDSSGSMGWNDRLNTRTMFVSDFIQRFKEFYPSNVLVDMVKFGSQVANTSAVNVDLGTPTTIKIDLNVPTRTSYVFNVLDATTFKGDVYNIESYAFTVLSTVTNASTIICLGDGSAVIPATGTLIRASGSGDINIPYSSYTASSINDSVVAYGFKNLENKHHYRIGDIIIGSNISGAVSLDNWQSIVPGGEVPLSIGTTTGPKDSASLNFTSSDTMLLRRPISTPILQTSNILSNVQIGDTQVQVDDISFTVLGSIIDLVSAELTSIGHTVVNVYSTISTIELNTGSVYNIGNWSNYGSIIQQSIINKMVTISGTTAELLVKDADVSKNITFFIQTFNGLMIEYDFQPYKEWYVYNIYYMDQTATLPISIYDKDNNPFPDGTEVDFYVNQIPSDATKTDQIPTQDLTDDAFIGDSQLFLDSTAGYAIGDDIDIINNKNISQSTKIVEIGTLNDKPYIKLADVLQFNFSVSDASRIVQLPTATDEANVAFAITQATLLPSFLSLVDITPIYTGRNLDPSLLMPYDSTPLSPSTSYADLNLDIEHVKSSINEVPSIDGFASIRILPITEDNLKTLVEKSSESARTILPDAPVTYVDQLEQASGDYNNVLSDASNAVSTVTSTTTTVIDSTKDYTIDTPVYLSSGEASGSMTTFATTLTEQIFDGITVPGISSEVSKKLLVKQYEIHPAIVVKDFNDTVIARQFLTPFKIYFTPPYSIFSTYVGDTISRIVENSRDSECDNYFQGYSKANMNGVYASSGNGFQMSYIIMNKGVLADGDTLRVRIYSNTVANLEAIMQEGSAVSRQDLNWTPPQVSVDNNGNATIVQPLSEIDAWRTTVENNPSAQTLEDTSSQRSASLSITTNDFQEIQQGVSIGVSVNASIASQIISYLSPNKSDIKPKAFSYYTKPQQWTKAIQCGSFQDIEIPIVAGKAILEVPASVSDVESILLIQASIYFGDNNVYESIRSDIVAVANPIDIGTISPSQIYALGGGDVYEIGTNVTWNEQPIDDNVIVNFNPVESSCTPAISKTSNVAGQSWAGSINIGPHSSVIMTCPGPEVTSPNCVKCIGKYEYVNISVSHLNYTRNVARILEWTGALPEGDTESTNDFYFKISDSSSTAWASSSNNYVTVEADLDAIENIAWGQGPHESGIDRLFGYDQDKDAKDTWSTPRKVSAYAHNLIAKSNPLDWSKRRVIAQIYGINQNIGLFYGELKTGAELFPYFVNINVSTNYILRDGDARILRRGVGASSEPYIEVDAEGNSKTIVPKPQFTFVEPLAVSMEIESYRGEFIRDNMDSPTVVATVTWENKPILNNVPFVSFDAGICLAKNVKMDSSSPNTPQSLDWRSSPDSCLTIGNHPDISLTSNNSAVSLSRTDIHEVDSNRHTHACQVNSSGEGMTTSTIVLDGNVVEHSHVISNYIALENGDPLHTHELRSVAMTKLNPTANPNVSIAINGYAWYDPTSCDPYGKTTPLPTSFALSNGTMVNRMMFDTLYFDNQVKDRQFELSMIVNNNKTSIYTAEHVTDTNNGINIVVDAKFSSYSVEDYPGHWIIMPERPVPDGTRIIFEINTFKPLASDQVDNLLIIKPDAIREYMYVSAKATVFAEGLSQSIEKTFKILSKQQWLPSVFGLLTEPTSDEQYIASALGNIDTLGASQIHDAVFTSAQRLIKYQTDNVVWKDAHKIIFLLTDGDENTSSRSIGQAISNVNFIDGTCEVPVLPLRLGYSYGSDEVILKRYASKTCGSTYNLIGSTEDDIKNIIDDIITSGYIKVNSGFYMNTIDLGMENVSTNVTLNNIVLPLNSRILFRYRISKDNINWNQWSEWYDSSVSKDLVLDIKLKGRYFQYQIYLYGNENFESPELFAGVTLSYYRASTFAVFFQPVDLDINTDEYLASIHITHKSDIPVTSVINYGYAQFNSVDFKDYYSTMRPLITPDRHAIILNRYNEIFLTQNNQKYVALNGGWMEGAQIEVYRIVSGSIYGELLDISKYAVNSHEGSITFYNVQNPNDKFVLCVYFDPLFRIVCNVINYGPESVVVDHIGIMYNIGKRIPKDNQGNIIHAPISERL